jgi:hypothetical protein
MTFRGIIGILLFGRKTRYKLVRSQNESSSVNRVSRNFQSQLDMQSLCEQTNPHVSFDYDVSS